MADEGPQSFAFGDYQVWPTSFAAGPQPMLPRPVRDRGAGDFNAYEFTDGYVDVLGQVTGSLDPLGDEAQTYDAVDPDLRNELLSLPAGERYSFVFNGSAQVLDHILTSEAAQVRVVEAAYARGNADAPASRLNDFDSPLRMSDHNGLVLFLAS